MTTDGGGWTMVYQGLSTSSADPAWTDGNVVEISADINFNQMRVDAANWPYSITRTTTETAKMQETFSWYHKWLQDQPDTPNPNVTFHSASTGEQTVQFTSLGSMLFGYGNGWRKIANPFYVYTSSPSYMYLGTYASYGINGSVDWGYGSYNTHMNDDFPTESGLGLTPRESQEIKVWVK